MDGAWGFVQSTSPEKRRGWFPRRLRSTEQKATLVLTSPEGSGETPGLSAQGEKAARAGVSQSLGIGEGAPESGQLSPAHMYCSNLYPMYISSRRSGGRVSL